MSGPARPGRSSRAARIASVLAAFGTVVAAGAPGGAGVFELRSSWTDPVKPLVYRQDRMMHKVIF